MLIYLFLTAAVISAAGFYRFVYFLSIGYSFSITGLTIAITLLHFEALAPAVIPILAFVFIYSVRLGVFILLREINSGSYKKVLGKVNEKYERIPIFVKAFIWIFCVVLYVMQVSPLFFRLQNNMASSYPLWLSAGTVIVALGLVIQTIADAQKNAAKKKAPDRFVDSGLFRISRCPNYFGEALVWTGVFLSSAPCLRGWFQIVFAVTGYIGIIYIMFGSARRLEIRQNKRYGENPEYQYYKKTTPVLIPGIPLYSIADWKWLFV
ncbi:MAG: DUF1295 domain-containing protein [Spirochaetia bacterium]